MACAQAPNLFPLDSTCNPLNTWRKRGVRTGSGSPRPQGSHSTGSTFTTRAIIQPKRLFNRSPPRFYHKKPLCARATVPSRGCSFVVGARPGVHDAFSTTHPDTCSASWHSHRRSLGQASRGRVIFQAVAHLEAADGLEGIPVVSGNREIIHSGGSANDRG